MRRLQTATAALLLVLSTTVLLPGVSAAQDDAGTGADAPDTCDGALDVSPGSLEGTLDGSDGADDPEDWYRLEVPDDKIVVVTVTPEDETTLFPFVRDDACGWLPDEFDFDRDSVSRAADPGDSDAVRFGVDGDPDGAVDYTVETAFYDIPDPTITDVEVTRELVGTGDGETLPGPQRTVQVTVENVATGDFPTDFRVGGVQVVLEHDDGEDRHLGYESVRAFDPEPRTTSFDWDGTGELGDVTVRASLDIDVDGDPTNNQGSTSSHVLVGGAGYGVDLLNRDEEVRVWDSEVQYESRYNDLGHVTSLEARGPGAHVGPLDLSPSAQAWVSRSPFGLHATARAHTPPASAFVLADDDGVLFAQVCADGVGCTFLP